jgi:hypothetical protein
MNLFQHFIIHCSFQFHGTGNRPPKTLSWFWLHHCPFIRLQYSICRNLSLQIDTYS